MRRGGRGNWVRSKAGVPLALALSLGLLGAAVHAEEPVSETPAAASGGWLKGWFGHSEKAAEKPAEEEELAPLGPSLAERIAAERDRQWRALHRRLAVCDQLKRIANDTNNDALEQQAIELENRAVAIYHQHTDHLSAPVTMSRVSDSASRGRAAADTSRPLGGLGRTGSMGEGMR